MKREAISHERRHRHSRAGQFGKIHDKRAEGLAYTSRLNDTGRCIMLFEQRLRQSFDVLEDYDLSVDAAMRRALLRLMHSQEIRNL